MIVARSTDEVTGLIEQSCVTIGNFDGVHLGHQRLIARVRAKAQASGTTSVVITFDPHPLRVLKGEHTPPFITLLDHKLRIISSLGVQIALVIPFTKELAALEPEEFVKRYLVDGLRLNHLVIGYDYSFGKGRKGNFEMLRSLGAKYGFGVERLDPVIVDGAIVSSTRIRDMVQAGKVWDVRPLLGRFYQSIGTVIHGHSRGRAIGFPTANLRLADELFPKPGVYAVWTVVDDVLYKGVANIGTNPTFGGNGLSVEVHILDYPGGDLYDREVCVHFVQRIRSERKFPSVDALVARIREDVELGRQILASPDAQP